MICGSSKTAVFVLNGLQFKDVLGHCSRAQYNTKDLANSKERSSKPKPLNPVCEAVLIFDEQIQTKTHLIKSRFCKWT